MESTKNSEVAEIQISYKPYATPGVEVGNKAEARVFIEELLRKHPETRIEQALTVLFLSEENEVLGYHNFALGRSLAQMLPDYNLIMATALVARASQIVTGTHSDKRRAQVSFQDHNMVMYLEKKLREFDIRYVDHLVMYRDTLYSFKEHKLL